MKIKPPLLATLFALGCTGTPRPRAALVTKAWHASPETNPMSSTAYRYAPWTTIESLRAGMSSTEATALIGPLQWYHHPVNAIVYLHDPSGQDVEVALRLSDDKSTILELSFKVLPVATRSPPRLSVDA